MANRCLSHMFTF